MFSNETFKGEVIDRINRIETRDILYPKQRHYQAVTTFLLIGLWSSLKGWNFSYVI